MTLMSAAFSLVWCSAFWIMSRDRSDTLAIALIGAVAAMLAIGLAASAIWPQILAGYPADSFWTLGLPGRAGVLLISTLGLTLLFIVLTLKTRVILRIKQRETSTAWTLIDLALALGLFAVLYSVSPQVFYSFYRLLFPDLPQQWVITSWIDPERLREVVAFSANGSMADHLAGIAFYAIGLFTLWYHMRDWWRGGL